MCLSDLNRRILAMSNLVLENGVAALNFARHWTLELLSDIPQDKLTHQPCAAGNHALWIAGHIAYADDIFMSNLGNKSAQVAVLCALARTSGAKPPRDVRSTCKSRSLPMIGSVVNTPRSQ